MGSSTSAKSMVLNGIAIKEPYYCSKLSFHQRTVLILIHELQYLSFQLLTLTKSKNVFKIKIQTGIKIRSSIKSR